MKKLFVVALFSIAMGYVESAVVVYLRELSSSNLTQVFPMTFLNPRIGLVEFIREAATIIMLGSVASIESGQNWEKFFKFSFMFGIWDISYYIFLKIITGWPGSILDFDILFLIPIAWIGPVIAPVLISILLSVSSFVILKKSNSSNRAIKISKSDIALFLTGSTFVFFSFIKDTAYILYTGGPEGFKNWTPTSFDWTPFAIGYILMLLSAARTIGGLRNSTTTPEVRR
ncbi:MAG: hypothetical protein ACP5US_08605 [Candidatus Kryptoniota bacterium]